MTRARNPPCEVIPGGTLIWTDEIPETVLKYRYLCKRRSCNASISALLEFRRRHWFLEHLGPEEQLFLSRARRELPDWPGFTRFSLTAEQLIAANVCQDQSIAAFQTLLSISDSASVQGGAFQFVLNLERPGLTAKSLLRTFRAFLRKRADGA